ncbi:MAG: hypothetical protein GY943_23130, partial [Chloroflexi bacterium]|nr:hypothetical protein [Chloroflexota bacterium]
QEGSDNDQPFEPILEQIEISGEYNFVAQIEQTLIPRPIPANFGKSEERIDSQLSGEVSLPDSAKLTWQFEAGAEMPPIIFEQEGADTYLIHEGERTQIENPMAGLSPSNNFIAYLHAAENLRVDENNTHPDFTVYLFDLNGTKMADFIVAEARRNLPLEKQNSVIASSSLFQSISGHGELWVDAEGYPQRQILDVVMPEVSEQYDSHSHIIVDFHFDTSLTGIPLLTAENLGVVEDSADSEFPLQNGESIVTSSETAVDELASSQITSPQVFLARLLGVILVAAFTLLLARSHRWLRVSVPVSLTAILLLTPILQPVSHAREKEREAALAPPTLFEALGFEEEVSEGNEEIISLESNEFQANVPAQQQLSNSTSCGSGDPNTDTDFDLLNDFVELCLGTSPYTFDTDEDGITDTLEINGFVFTTTQNIPLTFYSNPHEFDTNKDGLDDQSEWPQPVGLAPSIDPDGDDIPNLWDDDNDGDNIPDHQDLDPFSVTDYQPNFSLATGLNGSTYDGYQYIDFQVQPQDESHLRLITTMLDWPYDETGSIQARDVANLSEVTLHPVLKVTTNNAPWTGLQNDYGITVERIGPRYNPSHYEMYINLLPVSDGGHITAFSGRVAYGSNDLEDINWSKIELIWTVLMETSAANGSSRTKVVPIATYTEPNFRFAGLQISKNAAIDFAVMGTPTEPQTDHRQLANIVMGLEGSYLSAGSPDFDEIVNRISTPTTPISQTWGVPAANIAISSSEAPHWDATLAGPNASATLISQFLANNNYDTTEMASIIMATETEGGVNSLDGLTSVSGSSFTFNLADIPVQTMRGVSLSHYEWQNNKWVSVDVVDAFTPLMDAYSQTELETVLSNLQISYPNITGYDLAAVLIGFYSAWGYGQVRIITSDGVHLVNETASESALNTQINLSGESDFLTYLIEAQDIGVDGDALVFKNRGTYLQWQASSRNRDLQLGGRSVKFAAKIFDGAIRLKSNGAVTLSGKGKDLGWKAWDKVKQLGSTKFGIKIKRMLNIGANVAQKSVTQSSKFTIALKKIGTWLYNYMGKILSVGLQVAVLAFSLYVIWSTYGSFSSPYQFERDFALGVAITETVMAVALAALAITAVFVTAFVSIVFAIGFFLLIIDLIGLIIAVIFPDAEIGSGLVSTVISKLFVGDVRLQTKIDELYFEGTSVSFSGSGYALEGSTMTVSDTFGGYLKGYEGLEQRTLKSSLYGWFTASAGPNITTSTQANPSCVLWGTWLSCNNSLVAKYTFANAGLDQQISFLYKITAKLEYDKYLLGGAIKEEKSETIYMPDDLDNDDKWETATIYVDVLPNTLDDLIAWNVLSNYDGDGDGLKTTEEIWGNIDTDSDGLINSADWDSDNDGLSDGFEVITHNTLHAYVLSGDGDHDNLQDGQEYQIGTSPNSSDSDSDGISDGEELFHWDGNSWTGGGWYINISGTDYWTFSDPLLIDADGDGINDGSEMVNGTSPYAFNTAPSLSLQASPNIADDPLGNAVYVQDGDTVTATIDLYNIGTGSITNTLSLCFPSELSNVATVTGGDRQPTTQTNGDCRSWDFSSNPLQLFQSFQVTMTAQATNSTAIDTITASLPFDINGTPQPISSNVQYIQDNTPPTVQLTDPLSNSILTSQYYVIGGTTADATSFVDKVEVTVDTGTYEAVLTDAEWGYTWQLPADGVVTLTAVATDILGNVSAPSSVQVTVDTLPPALTINMAEGATISAGEALSTTFPLNGTATDNFAGLERIQLRYNEGAWRTIWDTAAKPLSANWDGVWNIPIVETAQGKHNLELRAYDAYGNVDTITRTVFIDILPPTNNLTNRAFIQEDALHVPGGQPVPLYGVASDAGNNPLPADPADLSGNLHSISDATLWLQVDSLSENVGGAHLAWLGDINGDRLGDLAVGLPGAHNGDGKVVVVKGSPGGWAIPTIGDLEFLHDNTPSY